MKLIGTFTAMITPFKGEHLDVEGLEFNIQRQLDAGIDGIVLLGTTGEDPTLSDEERKKVVMAGVRMAKGKVPVIVGCGHYSTKETIAKSAKVKEWGADAALIVTPYYNKPTQEGIYRHFETLVQAVDFPIIVYNIPGRCGVNIEPQTMKRIATLPNIIGLKESTGNLSQASEMIAIDDLSVLSGDDILTLPLMALGAKGVISVASNVVPEKIVEMVQAANQGNFEKAKRLHYELLALAKALFIETNPIPIKAAMELCGYPSGRVRQPLWPLAEENRLHLEKVLDSLLICR